MRKTSFLLVMLLALCLSTTASAASLVSDGPAGRLPIVSVSDAGGTITELTDGSTATAWTKSAEGSPDLSISLYYASVGEIWLRSGHCYSQNYYNHYDRPDVVAVTLWYAADHYETRSVTYRYRMTDAFRPNTNATGWADGYQRLLLPERIDNVSRIDLTIESVIQGYGRTGATLTDLAVTRGQHATATPRNATATPRPFVQYITPTPGPSVTAEPVIPTRDVVVITPQPTDPLVELITPVPATDAPVFYPSEGLPAKLTKQMFTRSGPSVHYDELGGFLKKGAEVNVISKIWDGYGDMWWFQVEVYSTEKDCWYRVYTPFSYVDLDHSFLPDETPNEVLPRIMARQEQARFGPGTEFGYNKYYPLYEGTYVQVYAIEDGWAQVEYTTYNASGEQVLRRAWVPVKSLEKVQ